MDSSTEQRMPRRLEDGPVDHYEVWYGDGESLVVQPERKYAGLFLEEGLVSSLVVTGLHLVTHVQVLAEGRYGRVLTIVPVDDDVEARRY